MIIAYVIYLWKTDVHRFLPWVQAGLHDHVKMKKQEGTVRITYVYRKHSTILASKTYLTLHTK